MGSERTENRDYQAEIARLKEQSKARLRQHYAPGTHMAIAPGTHMAIASAPTGTPSSGPAVIYNVQGLEDFEKTCRAFADMGWTVVRFTLATSEVVNYGD